MKFFKYVYMYLCVFFLLNDIIDTTNNRQSNLSFYLTAIKLRASYMYMHFFIFLTHFENQRYIYIYIYL